MNSLSPVEYLCTVTKLSILIVTRKPERYVQISSIPDVLNPVVVFLRPLRFAQMFNGPSTAWRKYIFFKVYVALPHLFHLQSRV